jgi:hypothetical protein
MVVGSRVRMLHGFGEGVVTKIEGQKVTVLLNEGLEIPIQAQDLVEIAAKHEKEQIAKADLKDVQIIKSVPNRIFFVKDGVFLAGFQKTNSMVEFSIVNHTDFNLSVVVFKLGKPVNQYFTHLLIEPKSIEELPDALSVTDVNHLVGLYFQILKFHTMQGDPNPCKEFKVSFQQTDWKKTVTKVPILEQDGYLFQMDGEMVKINPEAIKESMLNKKPEPSSVKTREETRKLEWREIDLHIENLTSDSGNLNAGQMLEIQIMAFDKAFDKALVDGIGSLIVIHGVGSGVLKQEIHKRLSQNKMIKFFKEGRKEKFGYGATEIQF